MREPFKGVIDVDVRDSVPDWTPFEPPKAPDGCSQRPVHRARRRGLLGDVLLRRADRHAQSRQDRRRGRPVHAVAHDRPVLAHALVSADRAQSHPQQHGLHHRGGNRVPERERDHPARERHALRDPRRAGLEYLHGRQVAPVPHGRDEPCGSEAQLAERPRIRALLLLPGSRDQPVVSRADLRQPSGRSAGAAGGGLPLHR